MTTGLQLSLMKAILRQMVNCTPCFKLLISPLNRLSYLIEINLALPSETR